MEDNKGGWGLRRIGGGRGMGGMKGRGKGWSTKERELGEIEENYATMQLKKD